jgi:lipopolysaccharide export system permease protein
LVPRLLFITSNRIGDAVLSTAALEDALARLPGADVTIACGPLPAPLFRAVPGLERIVTFRKEHGRWSRLWRALAGRRYDLAVDLRGSALTFLLPVRRRIVFSKSRQVQRKVDELAALMQEPPRAPRLYLDDMARADAAAVAPADPFLALGAGANFIGKRWPPERFAELARRLTARGRLAGAAIVLFGGPDDARANAEVKALLADRIVIDLTAALDLLACAALLERAGAFIGNDSGLMHIAAAMGAPTLGLFGPSDERVYGPVGPRARAVRSPVSYEDLVRDKFMPLIEHSLMEDLGLDTVESAAWALIEDQSAVAGGA